MRAEVAEALEPFKDIDEVREPGSFPHILLDDPPLIRLAELYTRLSRASDAEDGPPTGTGRSG